MLITETEIKKNWAGKEYPLVSFCCFTYNHEKYVVQTINSMLLQSTSFPFEIIIHDDASQDKTPEIIKLYQKEYPTIIKAIFQSENQYSKIGFKLNQFILPLIRGKYVAICEGDDYWSNPKKTEIQISFLSKNTMYGGVSCFTEVIIENGVSSFQPRSTPKPIIHNTLGLVLGKKYQLSTSALLYPTEVLIEVAKDLNTSVYALDNFTRYAISLKGPIYVLPEYMTVYRIHNGGVWSNLKPIQTREKIIHDLRVSSRFLGLPWSILIYVRLLKKLSELKLLKFLQIYK